MAFNCLGFNDCSPAFLNAIRLLAGRLNWFGDCYSQKYATTRIHLGRERLEKTDLESEHAWFLYT